MRNFDCWTCGHYTYRLKDTSRKLPDGTYQLLRAEDVFKDYLYSSEHQIALPMAESV
jgi:nitronate monooxygenase